MKIRIAKPKLITEPCPRAEDWVRLPRARERLAGFARTTILELCDRKLIVSVVHKKPRATRGIRLINLPSLLKYLQSRATGPQE